MHCSHSSDVGVRCEEIVTAGIVILFNSDYEYVATGFLVLVLLHTLFVILCQFYKPDIVLRA